MRFLRRMQNLYWIYVDPQPPLSETEMLNLEPTTAGPPPPDPKFTPIGHVSLDWEDYGGEDELADKAKGICTLATFFILGSLQGGGLGKYVHSPSAPGLRQFFLTKRLFDMCV
jgi:hypothetical protein